MENKNILIIEDDRTYVAMLTKTLQGRGFKVDSASNGKDGLKKAKSDPPDLIIVDVLMPQMSGYDFVKEIGAEENLKRLPMIIISSKKSMKEFFPVWAVHSFVCKPFHPEEIMEKIEDALGLHGEKKQDGETNEPPAVGEGKTAVIIGDNESTNHDIRQFLEKRHFSVSTATDASSGLDKSKKLKPEVIVCEFHAQRGIPAEVIYSRLRASFQSDMPDFVVFCDFASGIEAMKVFDDRQVLTYDKPSNLLIKLGYHLDHPGRAAA